jgi:hypothetical protein
MPCHAMPCLAFPSHGIAWNGKARQGNARHGMGWKGRAADIPCKSTFNCQPGKVDLEEPAQEMQG